jgi:hypothetical protein
MIIYNQTLIQQHKDAQEFSSINQAFEWFIKHTYPTLSKKHKKKLKRMKKAHKKGHKLPIKQMKRVLKNYGELEVVYRFKTSV